MSVVTPITTIAVGVVVERSKGASLWSDFLWRPVSVLTGVPETPPWTRLSDDGERATFYAGAAEIELYRSEASLYRDNLMVEAPLLWVALDPTDGDPPFAPPKVTADPAEGEGMTEAGSNIVEPVPMPDIVRDTLAAFVAEHHVEEVFVKRKRDRANPDSLGRRPPSAKGE